jgi:AcrR family transcriptional regulator
LTATVEVLYEHGVQAFNIALVCERAGVSRKTFYEIFSDREQCLLAAFEGAVEQATRAVMEASGGEKGWRERVRAGLTALLVFLGDDPGMGRLLVVDALGSGEPTLDARKRVLAQIITLIDQGRAESKPGRQPPPLTAEGVTGAVFSVIHARMLGRPGTGDEDTGALVELTGPLTAMILQPYLGLTIAQKEIDRDPPPMGSEPRLPTDPFKDLPIRLTYRTVRVLGVIAADPGSSSKHVAAASGVTDEGQMSRLLTRLERTGLIHNQGGKPTRGEAKAWTLTTKGKEVLRAVGES